MEMAILFVRPIIMSLDLAALLLCGQHHYHTSILLPDDLPEILNQSQPCILMTVPILKLTLKVAGSGPCVAM